MKKNDELENGELDELDSEKRTLLEYWKTSGIIQDEKVLGAFMKVPREDFLPSGIKHLAYDDNALPLMSGQTISQPTTVMIMTQALEVRPGMKVLEVGTASGYSAALLSVLVGARGNGKVITAEIIPELYEFGKKNLRDYKNVKVFLCDGGRGFEREAPFDRIIVTAACREIPGVLKEQLKDNGILVAPVGPRYVQRMVKIRKKGKKYEVEALGDFVFVPLTGRYGGDD